MHTASTASSGWTFLHQRQCPHYHIPLFHCIHCILNPLVWPFCMKDNVPTTIYHYSTVSTVYCVLSPLVWPFWTKEQCPHHHIPLFYCVHCTLRTAYCIHWFDLLVPKTMSPPPYTTIPLHPLHTVSTGLTFLPQRQCPHHHIPLFHCIHCILHPLVWPFCPKDNVLTTIYHYSTASTAYCIHCFDLFAPKTMSPPPYITIPLCPLHNASTGLTFLHQRTMSSPPYTTIPLLTASSGLTFLHQRQCPHHHIPLFHFVLHPLHPLVWPFCTKEQCPYHHIPLFHCVLHPLHPLVWPFCIKDNVPTTIYHYSTASTPSSNFCVILTQPDILHINLIQSVYLFSRKMYVVHWHLECIAVGIWGTRMHCRDLSSLYAYVMSNIATINLTEALHDFPILMYFQFNEVYLWLLFLNP